MKVRVKFTKTGTMKFLGHLDVMRYFQKVLKRSGLDVKYSQGFHPHPILSFASPLGVGVTSEGEYLDLELHSLGGETPDILVKRMNGELNGEIRIVEMIPLMDHAKPSMSLLAAADYTIALKEGYDICEDLKVRFSEFLSRESIPIIKKTKKGEKEIDLKEYVYDVRKDEVRGGFTFLRLAAGSVINIKPELLLEAFCNDRGTIYQPFAFGVHRVEMYADANAAKGEVNSNRKRDVRKLVPLSVVDVDALFFKSEA